MGWVDPQYIPVLQRDWRYSRLLRATEQLARRRERERREQRAREDAIRCGCQDGQINVLGADGRPYTVQCTRMRRLRRGSGPGGRSPRRARPLRR